MKTLQLYRLLTLFLLIMVQYHCFGQQVDTLQSTSVEIGKKYKFHSKILNEEREIWVRLPNGYNNEDDEDYPVIYLLDGAANFTFMTGLLGKLESRGVPKSILVGIRSHDRERDFTPETSDKIEKAMYPTSGGADDFKNMLEVDLFPFIGEVFKVNEYRTLIGHSLGGLFTVYTLATEPQLFNAYLAISPSLRWNDQKVVDLFESKLKEEPELSALLYLSMGNEHGGKLGPLLGIVSSLESETPENIRWTYNIHPNETHWTNYFVSAIEGLEFFYRDWYIPNPGQEYIQYGAESFKKRSKRIKKEFNEDWEMSSLDFYWVLLDLNESKRYVECIELALSLLEENYCFFFLDGLSEAYLGLDDKDNAIKYLSEAYKLSPGNAYLISIIDSLGIDKEKLVPTCKLSNNDLKKFNGTFLNDSGVKADLSYSRDTIRISNGKSYNLIPISKNKAYVCNSQITTVDFQVDNDIITSYVVNYQDGRKSVWHRGAGLE